MDNKEIISVSRILSLKVLAEFFLRKEKNNKVDSMYPKKGYKKDATLSDGDVYVLHSFLVDDFQRMGLDLEKIIESTGETPVPGKLSNYEIKELAYRADLILGCAEIFKDYEEANK